MKLQTVILLVMLLCASTGFAGQMEHNTDRPGSDYYNFDLTLPAPGICLEACLNDSRCRAYTYVRPGVQGPQARCWLKDSVPPPNRNDCCVSGVVQVTGPLPPGAPGGGTGAGPHLSMEQNTDRPGSDYHDFDMNIPDPAICQQACANDNRCRAYTYVKPGVQGPNARCWLKHSVPMPQSDGCCVSGVK